jgi:hypothetical protein
MSDFLEEETMQKLWIRYRIVICEEKELAFVPDLIIEEYFIQDFCRLFETYSC